MLGAQGPLIETAVTRWLQLAAIAIYKSYRYSTAQFLGRLFTNRRARVRRSGKVESKVHAVLAGAERVPYFNVLHFLTKGNDIDGFHIQ